MPTQTHTLLLLGLLGGITITVLAYVITHLKTGLYHNGIMRRGNRPRQMAVYPASTAEGLGIKPRRRSLLHQMAGTISHKYAAGTDLHAAFILETKHTMLDVDEAFCLGTVVGASIQADDTINNLLSGNAVQFESSARARCNVLGAILVCLAALAAPSGMQAQQVASQVALVNVGHHGVYACADGLELHLYYDGRLMVEQTETKHPQAPRWATANVYQLDHHTWMAELEDGTWASVDAQAGLLTQTIVKPKKAKKYGRSKR